MKLDGNVLICEWLELFGLKLRLAAIAAHDPTDEAALLEIIVSHGRLLLNQFIRAIILLSNNQQQMIKSLVLATIPFIISFLHKLNYWIARKKIYSKLKILLLSINF